MRLIIFIFGEKKAEVLISQKLFDNHQLDKSQMRHFRHPYFSIRAALAVLLQMERLSPLLNMALTVLFKINKNASIFSHPVLQRSSINYQLQGRQSGWSSEISKKWSEGWAIIKTQHSNKNVTALKDVYLFSSGITLDILNKRFHLLNQSDDPRLPFVAGQWNEALSFEWSKEVWLSKELLATPTLSVDTPLIDIRARCSSNYWHALLDGGTKLIEGRNIKQGKQKYLASNEIPSSIKVAYEALVGQENIIYIQSDHKIFSKEILIPNQSVEVFDNCFGMPEENCKFDIQRLQTLSTELISKLNIKPTRFEKIFVLRKGNWRNFKGQDLLVEEMVNLGFHVISPEELSIEEQVSVFNGARLIVGASGAAWANLIFCQKGTKILSICSNLMAPWDMHRRIAISLGLDYQQCLMETIFDRESYHAVSYRNAIHGNFELDIRLIKETIKNFMLDMN
jgi:hypothetical protein